MAPKKSDKPDEIIIEKMLTGTAKVWVKGLSPFIYNAMSEKARHELLFPAGRKTAGDKATKLKHEPMDEYRNSVYRRIGDGPTRLTFPSAGFKGAMSDAALEIPGAKKTQIGRLVWVVGDHVDVYGIPKVKMDIVRSAGIDRTPDVRTRAILPEWACCVTIRFMKPTLNETVIARLLETAGLIIGVGDFRQGKGKGNYGQFTLCQESDVAEIIKSGNMAAQDKALETPEYYDIETQSLMEWFNNERKLRGK